MRTPTCHFAELAGRHRGATIGVMGGAASLEADLRRIDADLWVSVNGHGAALRRPAYVVAMDRKHTGTGECMRSHIRRQTDAPVIGPQPWADFVLTGWPLGPRQMLSGVVALWVAVTLGGALVIPAGFDCYEGRREALDQHEEYLPFLGDAVRVVSWPLMAYHKPYEVHQ